MIVFDVFIFCSFFGFAGVHACPGLPHHLLQQLLAVEHVPQRALVCSVRLLVVGAEVILGHLDPFGNELGCIWENGDVGIDVGGGHLLLLIVFTGDEIGEGSLEEALIVLTDLLLEPFGVLLLFIVWHCCLKNKMID